MRELPIGRVWDLISAAIGAMLLVQAIESGWHYWAAVFAVWMVCDLIDYGRR